MSAECKVAGHCPMGCGETLVLNNHGWIVCSSHGCPNPGAVHILLADDEVEHIVMFLDDGGFQLQHPLRERLDGALFACTLHQHLCQGDEPDDPEGRYRAYFSAAAGRYVWEPLAATP